MLNENVQLVQKQPVLCPMEEQPDPLIRMHGGYR